MTLQSVNRTDRGSHVAFKSPSCLKWTSSGEESRIPLIHLADLNYTVYYVYIKPLDSEKKGSCFLWW